MTLLINDFLNFHLHNLIDMHNFINFHMNFPYDLDRDLYGFNFDFFVMHGFFKIMCELTNFVLEFRGLVLENLQVLHFLMGLP